MKKLIYIFIFYLILNSESIAQNTRGEIGFWSTYDSWVHMDPFYIDEPNTDVDNFRPVEYEQRITSLNLGISQTLMKYKIGWFGVGIHFTRRWSNRKHIKDGDAYFESGAPMTPYQTRGDYINYNTRLFYFTDFGGVKPAIGIGGEFKIEQISSRFIYIDNQTNASANPYFSIPVDEHIERRFAYYLFTAVEYNPVKHFFIRPELRLYFNEIEIDEKMLIKDQTDEAQLRPMITGRLFF
ncbi:MAG: hypothetical protein CMP49_04210 [Flavobacteriales bacterium]|jgi:hypothetical protein|nr:hypothetical protein [Flavobacteriales bacterium]|tara:strand:+ start:208 stop:924 length:717 start_codon:yes stop_codon:yes gene_type:complete